MSSGLGDEKIEELKAAFSIVDDDGDGIIATNELGKVMKMIGQELAEAELSDWINENNALKLGRTMTFSDFLNLIAKRRNYSESTEETIEAIRVFDRDGTGFLSFSIMHHILTPFGGNVTDEEVKEMLHAADTNGNGQIGYRAFVRMFMCDNSK